MAPDAGSIIIGMSCVEDVLQSVLRSKSRGWLMHLGTRGCSFLKILRDPFIHGYSPRREIFVRRKIHENICMSHDMWAIGLSTLNGWLEPQIRSITGRFTHLHVYSWFIKNGGPIMRILTSCHPCFEPKEISVTLKWVNQVWYLRKTWLLSLCRTFFGSGELHASGFGTWCGLSSVSLLGCDLIFGLIRLSSCRRHCKLMWFGFLSPRRPYCRVREGGKKNLIWWKICDYWQSECLKWWHSISNLKSVTCLWWT